MDDTDLDAIRAALSARQQVMDSERLLRKLETVQAPPRRGWRAWLLAGAILAGFLVPWGWLVDREAFKEAGWWAWPTVAAGVISLLVGLRFAVWPTAPRRVAAQGLTLLTFLCGLAGLLDGIVPRGITSIDGSLPGMTLLWAQALEASRSLHLSMPFLIVDALALTVGGWRLARSPGRK